MPIIMRGLSKDIRLSLIVINRYVRQLNQGKKELVYEVEYRDEMTGRYNLLYKTTN